MLAGFGQRKLPLDFGTSCSGNVAALPAYVPVNEPEYPQLIGLLTATFRLSVAASPGPNVSEPVAVPSAAQPSANLRFRRTPRHGLIAAIYHVRESAPPPPAGQRASGEGRGALTSVSSRREVAGATMTLRWAT
jgi:hypothetical protein